MVEWLATQALPDESSCAGIRPTAQLVLQIDHILNSGAAQHCCTALNLHASCCLP